MLQQHVLVYDEQGETAKCIQQMKLWYTRKDFIFQGIISQGSEVILKINHLRPDILILVEHILTEENVLLEEIKSMFIGLNVIVIGFKDSYAAARQHFLKGAFDYLLLPFNEDELVQALLRVYRDIEINYITTSLRQKIEALIRIISKGEEGGEKICEDIISQVNKDWKEDAVNVQIILDKAKKYIYELLINAKPWMEKFLYKNDFVYELGYMPKSTEALKQQWKILFGNAAQVEKKYQIIDDKLVYRIGKYIIVHIDERLTLGTVANGVFLNPSYVSYLFKKITGISFVEFITEVKIDRAKILLRDKSLKISEIAHIIGFNNSEYFSKNFRSRTGMAPIEFRNSTVEKRIIQAGITMNMI
jgi:two-component system, response regulator YesN